MQLFYAPEIARDINVLSPEESHHCIHVLRHKVGDTIHLIDGVGKFYKVLITKASLKACEYEILEIVQSEQEPPVNIHLAVAPTKNIERWEWMLEKATELGVSQITPLMTKRTERANLRIERLQKIILSATKQSLKAIVPVLHPPTGFAQLISNQLQTTGIQKLIAVIDDNNLHLWRVYTKSNDALILIGPEGDFTPEEIELAYQKGFSPVSLGRSRLRTETAAIAACHTLNMLNE